MRFDFFYEGDYSANFDGCFRKLKRTDYLIFGSNSFMESVFDVALKRADWQLCISRLLKPNQPVGLKHLQ